MRASAAHCTDRTPRTPRTPRTSNCHSGSAVRAGLCTRLCAGVRSTWTRTGRRTPTSSGARRSSCRSPFAHGRLCTSFMHLFMHVPYACFDACAVRQFAPVPHARPLCMTRCACAHALALCTSLLCARHFVHFLMHLPLCICGCTCCAHACLFRTSLMQLLMHVLIDAHHACAVSVCHAARPFSSCVCMSRMNALTLLLQPAKYRALARSLAHHS